MLILSLYLSLSLPPPHQLPTSSAQENGHVRTSEKADVYKPGREASPQTEFVSTLIVDF